MKNNDIIVRDSFEQYRYSSNENKYVPNCSSKPYNVMYPLPQLTKGQGCGALKNRVVLVNGCWNTAFKIPNSVADMHTNGQVNDIKFPSTCSASTSSESQEFFDHSPRSSDSGIESDCTDGNLSWLLNYKIHGLPPVPDSVSPHNPCNFNSDNVGSDGQETSGVEAQRKAPRTGNKFINLCGISPIGNDSSCKQIVGPKKPPFTYTELIEHALTEKGELTVSGIYQWISEHFPFYQQNDDRWKNSVRHNLSINPHFRKGSKAVHGAGHLWTLSQKNEKKFWQMKKHRMQEFMQMVREAKNTGAAAAAAAMSTVTMPETDPFESELQAATASILGENFAELEQSNVVTMDQCQATNGNIEVEFINIVDIQNGLEDFLSPPVSKQEIVQECGLGTEFLYGDQHVMNHNVLTANMVEGEVIHDGTFVDEMYCSYYEIETE